MILQILVNHYNEDIDIIKRFLDSLQQQTNIDFEVIIATDGGLKISEDIFLNYNFPIQYQYLEHSGVCHTRNVLLDQATADYIMFCDIDDIFLKNGLSELLLYNNDIIHFPFLEETNNRVLDDDIIHVHGKIFKREYIVQNHIRFPDEMTTNGDMMFLWLAYALTQDIVYSKNCIYIWKNNPNSVTRKNRENYNLRILYKTIQCYSLIGEDLKKRNRPDLLQVNIVGTIHMIYIYATLMNWENLSLEEKERNYIAIYDYLEKNFNIYPTMNIKLRKELFNTVFDYYEAPKKLYNFNNIIPWAENLLKSNDVLIIGYGIVGHNLNNELQSLNPTVYDKYNNYYWTKKIKKYKIAFICVPTPKTETEYCDISEVRNAINENDAEIYVVKSTVLPGTIDALIKETGKNIIFSPEYYGETQHCNTYDFNYTILGGNKQTCIQVQQILQKVYNGNHKFCITDAKTAELTKYMENSFLATKVSFCQQFYNIAEDIGVNYEELRELFVLDPRVNASHTFVYRDTPYWDSKCLNKDVPAIAHTFNASLLKDVINFNEKQKTKYNKDA